jgi:hypothetical protein
MKKDIDRIYIQLKYYGLVTNQFDYSTHWLGQCRSYYSSMKARQVNPCSEAALALLSRLNAYNQYLKSTDRPRTCHHFGQMSRMMEQEAVLIAEYLHQTSMQRVCNRHAIQMEVPA